MPSAVVKSALVRILPESVYKTYTTNMTIDKVIPCTLEDRLVRILRDNSSGPAAMDVSNLAKAGEQPSPQEEKPSEPGDQNQWEQECQQWWPTSSESEDAGAYALQKGKGKG